MRELCLAIALIAAAVSGIEYVSAVAVSWTNALIQAEDLEDMLDLDEPTVALDWDSEGEANSEVAAAAPASAQQQSL